MANHGIRRRARIIGRTCVLGMAMSGCARDSLDLAHEDVNARSAAAERAADAITRSREAIIAQEKKTGGADAITTEEHALLADNESGPSAKSRHGLAALKGRFFPGVGRRSERSRNSGDMEDPFLAAAHAESNTKSSTKRDASLAKGESATDALDELLKENKPVTHKDAFSSRQAEFEIALGKSSRPQRKESRSEVQADVTEEAATSEEAVAASTARPFPSDELTHSLKRDVARKPVAVASRTKRQDIASQGRSRRTGHPLTEEYRIRHADSESARPARTAIDGMLADSQAAADRGELSESVRLGIEAQRLADVRNHEFGPDEEQPKHVIARLAEAELVHEIEPDETLADIDDHSSREHSKFATASWGHSADSMTEDVSPREDISDVDHVKVASLSATKSADWPSEMAFLDTNDLWKAAEGPASEEAESIKGAVLTGTVALAELTVEENPARGPSSRNHTADLSVVQAAGATVSADLMDAGPIVELGTPSAKVPDQLQRVAFRDVESHKPVTPPTLSVGSSFEIDDADLEEAAAPTASSSRSWWYVLIGGALVALLVVFRKRAYGVSSK